MRRKSVVTAQSEDLRQRVAREAATLLYFGSEGEYKQAKVKAAEILGIRILPSNIEIARELDKIADETEGQSRIDRLIEMRAIALRIMKLLVRYSPCLVGSVWRGTINNRSDIDIDLYSDESDGVILALKSSEFCISRVERISTTEHGLVQFSFHVYSKSPEGYDIELVIRSPENSDLRRKCDIFGDEIKGLKTQELEQLISENPSKRFVPS